MSMSEEIRLERTEVGGNVLRIPSAPAGNSVEELQRKLEDLTLKYERTKQDRDYWKSIAQSD